MSKEIKIPINRRTSLEILEAALKRRIKIKYEDGQFTSDQAGILHEILSDGLLISKESSLENERVPELYRLDRIISITLPPTTTPGGVLIEGAKLSGLNETEAEK